MTPSTNVNSGVTSGVQPQHAGEDSFTAEWARVEQLQEDSQRTTSVTLGEYSYGSPCVYRLGVLVFAYEFSIAL